MGLYNRFCKRFFAVVVIRLTAQSDSRAHVICQENKNVRYLGNLGLYEDLVGSMA